MTRTGNAAVSWARNQVTNPSRNWTNYCLIFVRSSFDVSSKYASAEIAWGHTNKRHTTWPPPKGVPIWWTNGRYGHVAISDGNGYCYSTDFKRTGKVDRVLISSITKGWGQNYRGWTEDINEVKVYVSKAKLDASNVAKQTKAGAGVPSGRVLKRAVAKEVGKGKMNLNNNTLDANFKRQYVLVQKKYFKVKGYKPKPGDVDGIPGFATLTWLGNRRGFEVQK